MSHPRDGTGKRRQRITSYGICENAERQVLLVRAAQSLTVAGRWFLPGGGLRHGEAPVEGLRREFAEETGLAVHAETLLGVLSDLTELPDTTMLHTVRVIYRIEDWSGVPRAEPAGSSDAVSWFSRTEVEALPVMPYVRKALDTFA